jgi:3-methyladenine DNA glycosylase/8-oxoguanine DNA glycosylase
MSVGPADDHWVAERFKRLHPYFLNDRVAAMSVIAIPLRHGPWKREARLAIA